MSETEEKLLRPPQAVPPPVPVAAESGVPRLDRIKSLAERFPRHRPDVTVLAVPKDSEHSSSSEDSAAISPDGLVLAISDGVSQSALPGIWATALVQPWTRQPFSTLDTDSINKWLAAPREAWRRWVEEEWINYVNSFRQEDGLEPLTENHFDKRVNDEVLSEGASATFLGTVIDPSKNQIRVVTVERSDSCAFLVNPQTGKFESYPLASREQFNSRPGQVSSLERYRTPVFNSRVLHYQDGDYLAMATDAMSKWLMAQLARGPEILEFLQSMDNSLFRTFVFQEWDSSRLEEDDATVVIKKLSTPFSPQRSANSIFRRPKL